MRYELDADQSTLLIEARSSLGEIVWEGQGLEGQVDVHVDHVVMLDPPPTGSLTVDLASLSSGNTVFDSELLRRIEVRRHPVARVELTGVLGADHPSYALAGEMTFHGTTRPLRGTMELRPREDGTILVVGDQVVDIRDFDVPAPTVLMLKIYPDVTVSLVAVLVPTG